MTAREELRQTGAEIRRRLGLEKSVTSDLSPGYANLTDEIVFGRVWARPGLDLEDRMLATLSALTSKQYLTQLGDYVGASLHIGMPPRLIQEVMIHCAIYSGFPTAETSLRVVRGVLGKKGISEAQDDPHEADLDEMEKLGQQTMFSLHDERSGGGYAAPESAARGLYQTAIDYLYGEIWNRPGITHRQRMICSLAAFTATELVSQQKKFFRSAVNVGLSHTEIYEVISQTGPYSGFPQAFNALVVAEDILS